MIPRNGGGGSVTRSSCGQAPLGGTWQLYVYHSLSPMTTLVVREGSSGFADMGCGLTSEEMEARAAGHLGQHREKRLTQKRAHGRTE